MHLMMLRPFGIVEKVSCGNRSVKFRSTSSGKVKEWVAAINDAGLKPAEGWCQPHRVGSFAPPRGLTDDGSQAQWFVDGAAAFEAIASSIEDAKSQVLTILMLKFIECIAPFAKTEGLTTYIGLPHVKQPITGRACGTL